MSCLPYLGVFGGKDFHSQANMLFPEEKQTSGDLRPLGRGAQSLVRVLGRRLCDRLPFPAWAVPSCLQLLRRGAALKPF